MLLRLREGQGSAFAYADCSFGNLIFAGAYLETGSFNAATRELAALCSSQAELINVSRGECRALVALKEDGRILSCEAEIVGRQSSAPIRDLFFLERRPTPAELSDLADLPLAEKEARLRARQATVELSRTRRGPPWRRPTSSSTARGPSTPRSSRATGSRPRPSGAARRGSRPWC